MLGFVELCVVHDAVEASTEARLDGRDIALEAADYGATDDGARNFSVSFFGEIREWERYVQALRGCITLILSVAHLLTRW